MQHGFSLEAVAHAREALQWGQGRMAQFAHPELGGTGQWMPGMVMIGDAFNHALKARVQSLFSELATMPPVPLPSPTAWWPAHLGQPSQAGGQNTLAYAYFPTHHCLAVRRGDTIRLLSTAGHTLVGLSAQDDQLSLRTQNQETLRENQLPPWE